jgi:hypothetical protein
MNPFDPFDLLHLSGTGTLRYTTLALPTATVRNLLPHGLELGPQQLTPPGTHPVLMGFHDMFRLHTTVPSWLPSMTYHEHSVGIPCCYLSSGAASACTPGPYFFMPAVLLDHVWATFGGLVFWGYAKQLAVISNAGGCYRVARPGGEPLLSLSYEEAGEARAVAGYPHFEVHRQALSQTIISLMPLGMGPFFVVAGFPKDWAAATVTPLQTVTEVFTDYVIGLPSLRSPSTGRSTGIDASVIGSYELRAPWQLTGVRPLQ